MTLTSRLTSMLIFSRCSCSKLPICKKAVDVKVLQCQDFSLSSKQNLTILRSSKEPIKLSASPINNYKSTKTFKDGDTSSKNSILKWPLVVGSASLSILVLVMLFGKEEPLDIFSTETLNQFEEKVNSTFKLEKQSGNGNDLK